MFVLQSSGQPLKRLHVLGSGVHQLAALYAAGNAKPKSDRGSPR
jgi:hypothetical protein